MEAIEVDIREFREDIAKYIATSATVAVIQEGQTVGYFVPTQRDNASAVAALREAGEAMDRALSEKGIDVEELVAEFDALRKNARQRKRTES